MYNPDYPTNAGGSFLQHTYQPQQNMYNYWDGMMGMSMGMPSPYMNPYGMDSRRNDVNPVNPFNTFGQTQPGSMPMNQNSNSFPTSTPMGNAAGGLNGMINDSRRNMTQQPTTNNPWMSQTQQAMSQTTQQMQANPYQANPYAYNPYGNMYGYNNPMYNPINFKSFDNKNAWDNYYTQSRSIPTPVYDWRQQMNAVQPNQYQNNLPPYPLQQMQTTQQNWKDIAESNWKNSNI